MCLEKGSPRGLSAVLGPPVTVEKDIKRSRTHSTSNAATIAVIVVDVWAVSYVIELQLKLSDLNVLLSEVIL